MAEYIDRLELIDKLYAADAVTMKGVQIINTMDRYTVRNHENTVEVKRGKWHYGASDAAYCSACGFEADSAEASNYFNFCPNCGAQMEVDDGT